MEDINVDYLSHCIEVSGIEKNGNEEELHYPEVRLQQIAVKRGLEYSEEESTSPPKKYKSVNTEERFHWTPPLTHRLIEFIRDNFERLQNKHSKKGNIWRDIYEKLKPYCSSDDLTIEMVKKKWHNMLDYHKKLDQIRERTGKIKIYEFYDEMEELFQRYQRSNGNVVVVDSKPLMNIPQIIVVDRGVPRNAVPLSEGNYLDQEQSSAGESSRASEDEQEEKGKTKGKSARKYRRRREKNQNESNKVVETSIQELVLEHKKMIECEQKKILCMERACASKEIFNNGILNAVKKRTQVLETQQSSTNRINDILTMLQKYECKMENMDTRLLNLEIVMYRIEALLEKVNAKLNEK